MRCSVGIYMAVHSSSLCRVGLSVQNGVVRQEIVVRLNECLINAHAM